jgi:hypothetical protein
VHGSGTTLGGGIVDGFTVMSSRRKRPQSVAGAALSHDRSVSGGGVCGPLAFQTAARPSVFGQRNTDCDRVVCAQ